MPGFYVKCNTWLKLVKLFVLRYVLTYRQILHVFRVASPKHPGNYLIFNFFVKKDTISKGGVVVLFIILCFIGYPCFIELNLCTDGIAKLHFWDTLNKNTFSQMANKLFSIPFTGC